MPDELPPVETPAPIQTAPPAAPVPSEQIPPPAASLVKDGTKSERELQLEAQIAEVNRKAALTEQQLREVQALQLQGPKKKVKRSAWTPLIGADDDETPETAP